MPDQSTAATEHSITQDLSALPTTKTRELRANVIQADFPIVLRGYDRDSVDTYVQRTNQMIVELEATQTPEGVVRRALERVGDEVAGILRRAHETADQITAKSRSEADDRLQEAMREAHRITVSAKASLHELDAETDRVWAERHRIIEDARALAEELLALADTAAERFPATEEAAGEEAAGEEDASEEAAQPDAASSAEEGEQAGEDSDEQAEVEPEPTETDGSAEGSQRAA